MLNSRTLCIYCGEAISLSGRGGNALTVEHVIGLNLGGTLTIPAHKRCNNKANQLVDSKLDAHPEIGRIRGELGVRRRSGPYVHREVWDSPRGLRAFMVWTSQGIRTELIPVEIERADGDSEFFIEPDSRLSEDFEQKRRERVERDGFYLGEPRDSTDQSLVGKEVAIIFREPQWHLPVYLWLGAAAKFALGVLADGLRSGFLHESTFRSPLVEGLRLMAFEKAIATELWDPSALRYEPSKLSATGDLAQLGRHEHLLAIRTGEAGQSSVLQVVIFGTMAFELPLPGLPCDDDRAWLFDSLQRKVARLRWHELVEVLSGRGPRDAVQLQLDSVSSPVAESAPHAQ
jgi:hypothetical protein